MSDFTIYAPIRSDMSDLEIVNEIIRVVGYERLDIIIDMLEDRLSHKGQPELTGYTSFFTSMMETRNIDARIDPDRRDKLIRKSAPPNPDFPWPPESQVRDAMEADEAKSDWLKDLIRVDGIRYHRV